jgi:hemerythrin
MTEIEWNESYSVGVPSLDDQHKILIRLINQLHHLDNSGADLRDVMDRLDWYVHEHFSLEESLMEKAGYQQLDSHIKEHREFEHWLRSAQSHMATSGSGVGFLAKSVNDHLNEWLVKHILVVDMDYKPLLSEKESNGPVN